MNRLKYITVFFSFLILGSIVYAADLTSTPTDLRPADQGVLRTSITAAATTITIEPIVKWVSGIKTKGCFDTPAGFIYITDTIGRQEWASYGTKACSSGNVTTLTDVRRGLTGTGAASFLGGTGMAWDAGALIRVTDYPLLFTQSVYDDVVNTMGGSGAIVGSVTTQSHVFWPATTTAQRDAYSYNGPASTMQIANNSTEGTAQYSLDGGTTWINFGSGSVINATKISAGKVQLPELFHYRSSTGASTQLGDTGSPLVVALSDLISSSSGATASGRVVTTNELGVFHPSVGSTGTGGTSASSGALLTTAGTNPYTPIYPATDGEVVTVSNGTFLTKPVEVDVTYISTALSTATGSSIGAFPNWSDESYTIPADSVAVGDVFIIEGSIEWDMVGGKTIRTVLNLGSIEIARTDTNATVNSNQAVHFRAMITVRSIGAGGTVVGDIYTVTADANNAELGASGQSTKAFDTTANQEIKIGGLFSASDAGHNFQTYQVMVTKYRSN